MKLPHWLTPWRKAAPPAVQPKREIKATTDLPELGQRNDPAWSYTFSKSAAPDVHLKASAWVYTCADRIATSCAAIPLVLRRGGKVVPWMSDDPLAALLRQPMPDTTWSAWLEEVSLYLTLTGTCFLEKYRSEAIGPSVLYSGLGLPHELWPFGAGIFKPKIDKTIRRQVVEYYEPTAGNKAKVPTSEIVRIARIRPGKRDEGFAAVEAAEREISTDRQASEWQQVSLQNRGVPDGIISFDEPLNDIQERYVQKQMTDEWLGAKNAHRPMVLNNAKWLDLAKSAVDLELLNGRTFTRKAIANVMGIPEVVLDSLGSTYANLEVGMLSMMTGTVLPHMGRIVDALNLGVCREYGPDVYLEIDTGAVDALLPLLRERWKVGKDMLAAGVPMDQTSGTLRLGVEPYRGSDVGLVPSNLVPVSEITAGSSDADLGLAARGAA